MSFEFPPPIENNMEGKKTPEKLGALIVLDRIWRPDEKDSPEHGFHLSQDGKMRVLAAVEMYKAGLVDKIIFTGGKASGEQYPSDAESMRRYFLKKYPDIPEDKIILEEESLNTQENAEGVGAILEKYGIQNAALLTNSYHLDRAKKIFENQGIEVSGFPAEEWLSKRRSKMGINHYEKFVEQFMESKHIKWESMKEKILSGLLTIDRKGKIPRAITRAVRHGSEGEQAKKL
ncbi:MAG: hypothetical protein UX74_C0009G0026 [Parcubacteria group bacterium GW2011_GWA2_47_10b]|nr:MAG: hypothetical protein UX74_C0009G0026 [Parcubacteria group bacterium GW2011_GWA2_47_10b]